MGVARDGPVNGLLFLAGARQSVTQVANLISRVMTTAPMSIGSQKSEKIEQLSATIDSHAKPLR